MELGYKFKYDDINIKYDKDNPNLPSNDNEELLKDFDKIEDVIGFSVHNSPTLIEQPDSITNGVLFLSGRGFNYPAIDNNLNLDTTLLQVLVAELLELPLYKTVCNWGSKDSVIKTIQFNKNKVPMNLFNRYISYYKIKVDNSIKEFEDEFETQTDKIMDNTLWYIIWLDFSDSDSITIKLFTKALKNYYDKVVDVTAGYNYELFNMFYNHFHKKLRDITSNISYQQLSSMINTLNDEDLNKLKNKLK